MPPPASFVDIDTLPFSEVIPQTDFNIDNERWFRLILSADAVAAFYITVGGTFKPRYDLYQSDGSTLVRTVNQGTNASWLFPLDAGTYYLKVTKFGGGTSDFDFTFQCQTKPLDNFEVPEDAVVINDDTGLFPAIVVQMDGTVLGFLRVPSGEVGASLPTGESLWQDRSGRRDTAGTLALFDETGAYVLSTAHVFSDFPVPPSVTSSDTDFYVLEQSSGDIYKITPAGVVTVVATLSITTATSIGVSRDGSTLYYVDADQYINAFDLSDNVIHRWDLDTDTPLADFYTVADGATDVGGIAVTANFWPAPLLVLEDDSVVTWFRNEDGAEDVLLHISSAGSLLHSYTYTHASRQIDHISRPPGGGSTTINIWWYTPDTDTGRIATLLLADGTEVEGFDTKLFSQGINMVGNDDTFFGPSTSCAMVTLLLAPMGSPSPPPPGSPGGGIESPGAIGPISWIEWPETTD